MRRNNPTSITLNVNGLRVESVTILGLARIIGKSRTSVLRYEKSEVFPPAPLKVGNVRYYPISLARRLIPLVDQIPQYKKPDASLISEINKVFKEERNKLCQQ